MDAVCDFTVLRKVQYSVSKLYKLVFGSYFILDLSSSYLYICLVVLSLKKLLSPVKRTDFFFMFSELFFKVTKFALTCQKAVASNIILRFQGINFLSKFPIITIIRNLPK